MYAGDMKTTVGLDERLYSEAQRRASRRGSTLAEVVEEALRAAFEAAPENGSARVSSFPIFTPPPGLEGLNPGYSWDTLGFDSEDIERAINGTR